MPRITIALVLSLITGCVDERDAELGGDTASVSIPETTSAANFNGTPIAGGRHVWFSSVVKVSGLGAGPAHVFFTGSHLVFDADGVHYDLSVPAGELVIDPAATLATTSFDAARDRWTTVIPRSVAGKKMFLTGLAFPVPAGGLPGGIKPVAWKGVFTSDAPGLTVSWQWAAAVYTQLTTDGSLVGVKPTDDNHASGYLNSDHAGTPESFKPYVIGGARGGGGSNYTGSLSGTVSVSPPVDDPCAGEGCIEICGDGLDNDGNGAIDDGCSET